MALKRRMGPENSAMRATLMDAVEAVMREQGYAALSVRSVAARAGLKYQLVFYYFETMDDLLLTTYRRRTARVLELTAQALQADRPLHAFWEASSDPFDAALTIEYMAMSNHHAAIRAETIAFGERLRNLVAERMSERIGTLPAGIDALTPMAITSAIRSIGALLGFEAAMGISGGHEQTKALVQWCLDRLEPEAGSTTERPGAAQGRRGSAVASKATKQRVRR